MPTLYSALRARYLPVVRPARPVAPPHAALRPSLFGIPAGAKEAAGAAGRVLIVGAGFAGLVAAYELQQARYAVEVYEALNRPGGRVDTRDDVVYGKQVEAGGELIGSNHPTWWAYKQIFNLDFLDVSDEPNSPVVVDGKILSPEEESALFQELHAVIRRLTDLAKTIIDPYQPWLNPDAATLDAQDLAAWIDTTGASPQCPHALRAQLESDNGVRADRQSLLGNLAMIKGGGLASFWTDTEVYRCKGGNALLAKQLEGALTPETVKYGAEVTKIEYGDPAVVRVTVKGDDKNIKAVDHVVLTAPPKTWPHIRFDPDLQAPKELQAGRNVKCLLPVKRRFWRDANLGVTMSADGPIDVTWEGTERQGGIEAELTAFSGGPDVDEIAKWPADRVERARKYVEWLEQYYPGMADAVVLERARFMNWPGEKWSAASYSFPSPGEVTTNGPWLHGGVGRLHFAGEHTCYAFVGYMEGALNSGLRVARQIASQDRLVAGR
jgi:monoamine oxidase